MGIEDIERLEREAILAARGMREVRLSPNELHWLCQLARLALEDSDATGG